jgi:conjugal transfer pilus assembly protein TraV
MSRRFGSVLAVLAVTLSGCVSLSGLDATRSYACKAPDGVTCMSVSGVYANSTRAPQAPAQEPATSSADSPATYGASSVVPAQAAAAGAASHAIRSGPRLLRVWIAPWADSDGDLHEQAYLHMLVNTGRWLIDHVRPTPREQVDGVAPPLVHGPVPTPSKTPAAPEAAPLEP